MADKEKTLNQEDYIKELMERDKVVKAPVMYGGFTRYACDVCGGGVREIDNFCGTCGQRVRETKVI